MPTPSALKALIDSQVTDKTTPYSISNVDVGERMKDIVDLVTGDLQFTKTADRNAYLLNPLATPGQKAFDQQDGNRYFINVTGTGWVPMGFSAGFSEIIFFTGQTTLTVNWTDARKTRFGAGGHFAIEVLSDDGKYRQIPNFEIVVDDIIDTSQYTINLGGSQDGRLIIK